MEAIGEDFDDVLRTETDHWLLHHRHFTGTKAAPLLALSEHKPARQRQSVIDEFVAMRNTDAPAPADGNRAIGATRQPESVKQYLLLTHRIRPFLVAHSMSDLLARGDGMDFAPTARLTYRGFVPTEGIDRLRDDSVGWRARNQAWRDVLATYGPQRAWMSVSPPGLVWDYNPPPPLGPGAGGLRGVLLVKTVLQTVVTSPFTGGLHLPTGGHVRPKRDTILQALLCLICDPAAQFVEIAMVHADWMWVWRLQRDDWKLRHFFEELAPAIADWGRVIAAANNLTAADEQVKFQAEQDLRRPTLLLETHHNVREAAMSYWFEHMRVRKYGSLPTGGEGYYWGKRVDGDRSCIDAIANYESPHATFRWQARNQFPIYWVFAGGSYRPSQDPRGNTLPVGVQPTVAFNEMSLVQG